MLRRLLKTSERNPAQASAKIIDGKLILSLPHALTPVVWQMDMGQAKASALEVRENKTAGHYMLVLKTPRGEATDVAPFETRDQAVDALMAVSGALSSAHGRIRAGGGGASESDFPAAGDGRRGRARKWVPLALAALLFLILFNVWGSMAPRPPQGMTAQGGLSSGAPAETGVSGAPVDADAFLSGGGG